MELVEGEDLQERIARGSMPIDEVLPIALQIAEAPEELFETDMFPAPFDVCPDGRFVFIHFSQEMPTVHGVDVAVGWTQTLPQLVPE